MRLTLLLSLALPAVLSAQPRRDTVIFLSTNRVARTTPDKATWYAAVEGVAPSLEEAHTLATERTTQLTRALRALGPGVEIGDPIVMAAGPQPQMRGYGDARPEPAMAVRSTVRIRAASMRDFANAILASAKVGIASASTPHFESSNTDADRQREIDAALAALRADAERIATQFGAIAIELIDLNATIGSSGFTSTQMLPVNSMQQSMSSPEVPISIHVSSRFRLVR